MSSKKDETQKIMEDKKLYKALLKARKEGSKIKPYEPLVNSEKGLFERIATKLRKKGEEYYDKGDRQATAIFWELEAIFREVSKNE